MSKETGFSTRSIYVWRKKRLEGGNKMRTSKKKAMDKDAQATEKDKEIKALKAQLEDQQT